ncbi:MAG TPA: trypsin-like serine protease [Anaerolineae bacterium]|nr:trypsin-like serine protease [Anaerolineae bacterium]
MRKFVVPVLLLLTVIVWVAPAAAIVYGEPDGKNHPNVGVAIAITSTGQASLCSGTLIHPQVFLTAGHCTALWQAQMAAGELKLEGVKVSFDASNAFDSKAIQAVKQIITHPEFDGRSQSDSHDVGVLILSKSVKSIKPASLPSQGFLDTLAGKLKGTKFTVVGYGAGLNFPPPQFIPPDGTRRVAASEFQTLLKTQLVLSQNKATDGAGTCHGDSGGPAFWTENGAETLVAITSLGDPNCVATGRYYRIDIPGTLIFINDVINSLK